VAVKNDLSCGTIVDAEYTDKHSTRSNLLAETEEYISLLSRLTMLPMFGMDDGGWGWFQTLEGDEQERIFTIDDVRDVRPFVTSFNWSLEKMFCRQRNSRYIAIVRGPGAVTVAQMRSSLVCSIIGTSLLILLVFSILMYLDFGMVFTMFAVAVGILVFYPSLKSAIRLYKFGYDFNLFKRHNDTFKNSPDDASLCVYLSTEVRRITRPTKRFCYVMLALEMTVFFLYPLISLFNIKNYPLALIFLVVGSITFMRYYVNAAIVLEETGNLDLVNGATERDVWKNQSRLNEIVGNITRGRSRGAWTAVLGSLGFIYLGMFLGAVGSDVNTLDTFDVQFHYTHDFYYEQEDSLVYPSCRLTSDLGDSPLLSMAGKWPTFEGSSYLYYNRL